MPRYIGSWEKRKKLFNVSLLTLIFNPQKKKIENVSITNQTSLNLILRTIFVLNSFFYRC